MRAQITQHAVKRGKERLNLNAQSLSRLAQKALNEGIKHSETRGGLNRYIHMLYLEHRKANNIRIYGEHLFLFCGNLLVTVLYLPHEFRRAAQKAARKTTTKRKNHHEIES